MPKFVLELEAVPDPLNREPAQRLRALLKHAKRSCALRCVAVQPVRPTQDTTGRAGAAEATQGPPKENYHD